MANTTNTSTLITDFNVSPYYDDYDQTKKYYRILYKPGYAVQGRELTQSQTMLQKQVSRFGQHIFQEGSIVLPGTFSLLTTKSQNGPVKYVKVNDYDNSNTAIDINDFLYTTVTGATTGIRGEISFVLDGTQTSTNTKTIYVDYLSAANSNSSLKVFQAGEVLVSNVGNLVVHSTSPTGLGSAFRISEGVFFAKEHFIYFDSQGIILDRYNPVPTCKVGFQVIESIVDATDDASLLDPALESSNYSAPGADRLKITPTLQVVDFTANTSTPDFVTLFTINNGLVVTNNERSQYNILQDEMAKRTYDESGDYYVYGLNITLREHLSDGENNGVLASANGGNSQFLFAEISPGLSYVQGYERLTEVTYMPIRKSTTYNSVNSQLASAAIGSYVTVKELTGSWEHDTGLNLNLYDLAQIRLTSSKWSTGAQTGNVIGTATLVTLDHNTGTMGVPDTTYTLYLTDIRMLGSNNFSNVRSIFKDNSTTADIGADIVLDTATNTAILQETSDVPLLYFTGSNFTKTLKPSNSPDTTFIYKHTTEVANVSSGVFNVSLPTGADDFPYGTATLTSAQKREIMISLGAEANISMSGTVSNSGLTITGSSTNFDRLNVGDKVGFSSISGVYYITAIASATSITVTPALSGTVSGASYVKRYKVGDIIDLTNKGATAGVTREVTSTSGIQLSFDLKETLTGTVPATVTYRVSSTSSGEINKTLRSDRFVKINVAAHSSGTSGPYGLGIPDVYRIKEIRKASSALTANTEGTDVTSSFIFDNGQRDLFYDHATITPRSALAATDHLLVKLDYFEPDFTVGQGFFSVDSYPIDDSAVSSTTIKTAEIPIYKSPATGTSYDLRNYLDFRGIKARVATDSTTVAGADTNPASTTTFNYDANGMRIPAAYSQISFDYEYYLARRDLITLNKDKQFYVVYGIPDEAPFSPSISPSDKVMVLGSVYVAPYPSLSPFYANIINRRDLSCIAKKTAPVRHTQKDIGVLKDRIINLEYYAALSLLEKSAVDMKITDSSGLDRFKNGIFVDTFTNHLLGATYNSDYRIVVDPDEKSIRPIYTIEPVQYDILLGSNIRKTGDLILLDYDQVRYIDQGAVTTNRNTERTTYRFVGQMFLTPEFDVWTDTQTAPDASVVLAQEFSALDPNTIPLDENAAGVTTTWNSWQRHITGYRVYRGSNFVGTYDSQTAAQQAAESLGPGTSSIETLFEDTRTGVQNYNAIDGTTVSFGDSIIDTSIIPYIRPQDIFVEVRGLKALAKHYVYFDRIRMNEYVTPISEQEFNILAGRLTVAAGTILDSGARATGTQYQIPAAAEGSALVANSSGNAYFRLRLPTGTTKRFTFGTKEILVTDSLTRSAEDQTSFATGYFTAQGLTQTTQETTLTTRNLINNSRLVTQMAPGSSTTDIIIPPPEIRNPFEPETPTIPPDIPERPDTPTTPTTDPPVIEDSWPTDPPVTEERCAPLDTSVEGGGAGLVCVYDNKTQWGWKPIDCMAYSFKITAPNKDEGAFITSVRVYCSEKHPTLGVWFEILETNSAGQIIPNTIPFSRVWKTSAEVPISTNGKDNPLTVTFDSPIFLHKDRYYAFVIHPESGNSNYYFWVSRLGETDINTGQAVNSRINTGRLYTTNNGLIWDVVPDVDLTMQVYRASFDTSIMGRFILGNKSKEKLYLSNLSSSLTHYGATLAKGDSLTITGITGGTINVTDRIIGTNSAVNAAVMTVGSTYNVAGFGYITGEPVSIRFANGTSKGVTANITSIGTRAMGKIEKSRESATDSIVHLKDSTGGFIPGTSVITTDGTTAIVQRVENFRYSVVDFEPSYLKFQNTSLYYEMKTYSNVGVAGSFVNINPNENYSFTEEKSLFSRTNEVASHSNNRTNQVQVTFRSTSDYVSPVMDIGKTQAFIIDNIINSNTLNETSASGGKLYNKYISKTITLAERQDAEDLRVILTAYRPPTTDVRVWVRLLHAEDGTNFALRPWVEMEKMDDADGIYSSSANKNDFIEYSYKFPDSSLTGSSGEVQYRNLANTATFTGYKNFAVKIGLTSNNSAIIPRVADLRCLALQI